MKITTLCFGNINRSPAAEYILRQCAEDENINLIVQSAGTSNYNAGKKANKTMRDKVAEYGYNLEDHRAKQITQEMIDESDVILCMDPSNSKKLIKMFPDIEMDKIVMIADFIDGLELVPDPHFTPKEEKDKVFTECYEAIKKGCSTIAKLISSGGDIKTDSSKGGIFEW